MTSRTIAPRTQPLAPSRRTAARGRTAGADRCRRKFLRHFPGGFRDPKYLAWERGYKEATHERWQAELGPERLRELLRRGEHATIARLAIGIESRTHLLFSFEKMALRDAVRSPRGARVFAEALAEFLHGAGPPGPRFDAWCDAIASLPHARSRVLTWPVVTVFGFLADPARHLFFKPMVTRAAARRYGVELPYAPRPTWDTYRAILAFATTVRRDLADLRPRDLIDVQSFLWVQGSEEYPG